MLKITIPGNSGWDEEKEEFVETTKPVTITLEHSLVSISKWEAKWHKCFLGNGMTKPKRTYEEMIDYIKCMTITQNVDPAVYYRLTRENIQAIHDYMNDPMTATHFADTGQRGHASNEAKTSELIYYWMVALQIPPEYQKWHINRLLTLIEVCNRKQEKPKKMSASQVMAQNRALNRARRAKSGSRG